MFIACSTICQLSLTDGTEVEPLTTARLTVTTGPTDAVIIHLTKLVGAQVEETHGVIPLTVTIFITGHTGGGKGEADT